MASLVAVSVGARTTFHVPKRFTCPKRIGTGCFRTVCCFKDENSGRKVCVHKEQDVTADPSHAREVLREVKLMSFFEHENVQSLLDLLPPPCLDFEDLYVVMEHLDVTLHRVIHSRQQLTDAHFQYFTYQLFRGLKYLHSADVVHRKLKSSVLLVSKECDLKISSFVFARPVGEDFNGNEDSAERGFVVQQWGAAPEDLLAHAAQPSVDIWAAGCILGEMLGQRAVFQGRDRLDQVKKIISALGSQDESALEWLALKHPARAYLKTLPACPGQPWTERYPEASRGACSLLEGVLQFSPDRRFDATRALEHEYFSELHQPEDEPVAAAPFPWPCLEDGRHGEFQERSHLLRGRLYLECASFREELLERDADALGRLGVRSLLETQRAEGWHWPKWRPVLQAHWRAIALVVLKSGDLGVRSVAAAMSEWGLRLALLQFLLPAHLKCSEELLLSRLSTVPASPQA